ncbi:MAG TPA: alpha/beta fold hydrolase [Methanomassiliicoccales archaeon]|nr:alpha/beta fold hydrolase [Methanomassiliicoccales archaeon]
MLLEIIIAVIMIVIAAYVVLCYFLSRTILYLDRQPVPKNPKDYGMDYEPANFKSEDGVDIKGWLIPGPGNKTIIMTHVGGLTKYGSTKQFHAFTKLYDEEIEFLKVARHLHDHGYGVLMFDFRNHGESGRSPNGGKTGIGIHEYRDVVAALDHLKNDERTKDDDLGFVSFCMGADSTIVAMSKRPDSFAKVKCMVAVQPISMEVFVRTYFAKRFSSVGAELLLPTVIGFVNLQSDVKLHDMSPRDYVKDIKVPTLYVQTRADQWTQMSDIQGFYDNTKATKDFLWLEGLNHRFQGYQYFGDHPEKMLEWLGKWM